MKTLSNRAVEKLVVHKDTVFWDGDLTGFGVRVYPTGTRVYIAQARGPRGPKRVAVGRYGVISADQARQRAALIIARIRAGEEAIPKRLKPAGGPRVAALAERYLTEYISVRCKPSTVAKTGRLMQIVEMPMMTGYSALMIWISSSAGLGGTYVGGLVFTAVPGPRRCCPAVTIRSPGFTPEVISTCRAMRAPISTGTTSILPSTTRKT